MLPLPMLEKATVMVGGSLFLGHTKITDLLEDLMVGGRLDLRDTAFQLPKLAD